MNCAWREWAMLATPRAATVDWYCCLSWAMSRLCRSTLPAAWAPVATSESAMAVASMLIRLERFTGTTPSGDVFGSPRGATDGWQLPDAALPPSRGLMNRGSPGEAEPFPKRIGQLRRRLSTVKRQVAYAYNHRLLGVMTT